MPVLSRPDSEIYYEVHGEGYPVLIFAPGGLRSELAFWRQSPSNPDAVPAWMNPMVELAPRFTAWWRSTSATPGARAPRSPPMTAGTVSPLIISR